MTIDTITYPLLEFAIRVISHKFYQSNKLNSVPCIAVDVGYKIGYKTKSAQCKFGSILVCIFFYVQNEFPYFGKVRWKKNRSVVVQINEYIEQMGDNFESVMTSYFQDIKKSMKQRLRIHVSLVEQHYDDICFLVDIDYTFIQVAVPRVRWLRPLGYEINVDEASTTITALLVEEVDKGAKIFGNYDVVKYKVEMELNTAYTLKKKDKLVRKLKTKFGVSAGDEEEEDDEENEEKEEVQTQEPLALTQGMGEDQEEEGIEEEEIKEAPTQLAPKKRKAKVQPVAKPKEKKSVKPSPAKPTTPTTKESTRATTQKAKAQVKEK